ncbi:MAG: hypothetical protein AB1405_04555 [Bdellovibrionota bacterium]
MIAPDAKIIDVDMVQLANWAALFSLRKKPTPSTGRAHLLLVVENGEVVKAYHSEKGALEDFRDLGPKHLEEMAQAAGAGKITRIERGALERFWEKFQGSLPYESDFTAQLFTAIRAIRLELGKTIQVWPGNFKNIRYLSEKFVRVGLSLLPLSKPFVAVVFDSCFEGVYASFIVSFEKKGKSPELSLWTTTDRILAGTKLPGDFQSAVRTVSTRIQAEFGKPALAVYFTRTGAEKFFSNRRKLSELSRLLKKSEAALGEMPFLLQIGLRIASLTGL